VTFLRYAWPPRSHRRIVFTIPLRGGRFCHRYKGELLVDLSEREARFLSRVDPSHFHVYDVNEHDEIPLVFTNTMRVSGFRTPLSECPVSGQGRAPELDTARVSGNRTEPPVFRRKVLRRRVRTVR
jgi:hypothetical protein